MGNIVQNNCFLNRFYEKVFKACFFDSQFAPNQYKFNRYFFLSLQATQRRPDKSYQLRFFATSFLCLQVVWNQIWAQSTCQKGLCAPCPQFCVLDFVALWVGVQSSTKKRMDSVKVIKTTYHGQIYIECQKRGKIKQTLFCETRFTLLEYSLILRGECKKMESLYVIWVTICCSIERRNFSQTFGFGWRHKKSMKKCLLWTFEGIREVVFMRYIYWNHNIS